MAIRRLTTAFLRDAAAAFAGAKPPNSPGARPGCDVMPLHHRQDRLANLAWSEAAHGVAAHGRPRLFRERSCNYLDIDVFSLTPLRVDCMRKHDCRWFILGRCRLNFGSKSQKYSSIEGADLLLQVRCTAYNGTLGAGFGHRFDRIAMSARNSASIPYRTRRPFAPQGEGANTVTIATLIALRQRHGRRVGAAAAVPCVRWRTSRSAVIRDRGPFNLESAPRPASSQLDDPPAGDHARRKCGARVRSGRTALSAAARTDRSPPPPRTLRRSVA